MGSGSHVLCCRLFKVSAASMSSIDRPERTLAALVVRSYSGLGSKSMTLGLLSMDVRCAVRGGEKGGGTAYGGL